jgi:hypothetical protein
LRFIILNSVIIPKINSKESDTIATGQSHSLLSRPSALQRPTKPPTATVTTPISQLARVSPVCSFFASESVTARYSSSKRSLTSVLDLLVLGGRHL